VYCYTFRITGTAKQTEAKKATLKGRGSFMVDVGAAPVPL